MKTSELNGDALNWAVILALGQTPCKDHKTFVNRKDDTTVWWLDTQYHKRWDHAGPIIERIKGFQFKQWLECKPETCCEAHIHNYEGDWIQFGPTPLIAAMRCYVASKLGDEVEVPEELM